MTDPATIVAVAGVALLLQAVVVVYLYRTFRGSESAGVAFGDRTSSDPESGDDTRSRVSSPGGTAGDSGAADAEVACPVCGIPNDSGFRFCRRCVSDLSGNGRPDGALVE